MQSVAGAELDIELTQKDIEVYWKGRTFIEAARIAHELAEDKTAFTMAYDVFEPHLEQAAALISAERDCMTDDVLPDAVFEGDNKLEPHYVIMLALMLEVDRHLIGETTHKSLHRVSKQTRDKKIVVVLNNHDTDLARYMAVESGFTVKDSGVIEICKRLQFKQEGFFDGQPARERKEPDPNLRAVRNDHNHRGKHFGNQRHSAKPQRQNFKGRGR